MKAKANAIWDFSVPLSRFEGGSEAARPPVPRPIWSCDHLPYPCCLF